MTEAEWLAGTDARALLDLIAHHTSDRKLRLLAVAIARRLWDSLDEQQRKVFQAVERLAEGEMGMQEFRQIDDIRPHFWLADISLAGRRSWSRTVLRYFRHGLWRDERRSFPGIARHIFGNPFRPVSPPSAWPLTAVQLAKAVYDTQNGRLILADALEETGHSDLAQHFRGEPEHPKGCWVLDLLLGKK